ncbi:MAG: TonB-dependent receptor, partial [Desulfarculus sp.]|nr:TonB-dependent receptor [Desulfarculus sp.]
EQYVTDIRYSGTRSKVDGFTIFNAKLNYAFKAWRSDWSVFVAGENLTDQEYAYKKDYPMPGINGMLGLEVRF